MNAASLAHRIIAGDRQAAARLITRVELGDIGVSPILEHLYLNGGNARVVGVTGPPGAGKSTLVDSCVTMWRAAGKRVAVLAVDPSSPLSGGAVLGDRVRMGRHAGDPDVLIRSMAARGALGGLAEAAGDALTIIDALGFDIIVVETVGVGQSEIEVLTQADVVIVLQTPEGGDGIQSVKAGLLEIADIFVVNKVDVAGAERMVRNLREMVAHRKPTIEGWNTPVIPLQANRGEGVSTLIAAVDDFFDCWRGSSDQGRERSIRRMQARVVALAHGLLRRHLSGIQDDPDINALIAGTVSRTMDPHAAAHRLVARLADSQDRR
ncbi:methylmalonyl Co-A mutase-associated GTPase MeaB [Rhizorhabdus argentea]|uniref:methylmalonyl Co-A mutase-associated GTPase MeaB n=1 Tax=Rhizorhabdus argentea TaxID=1387174 RepID=UPI0030EDA170